LSNLRNKKNNVVTGTDADGASQWMPPSREQILGTLRGADAPVSADDLAKMLLVEAPNREILDKRLAAMERDGQLLPNRKGLLLVASKLDFTAGKVLGHRDGFGFLLPDDGGPDIYLNAREMRKVMHGDRVLVKQTGFDKRGKPEGTIVEVTERINRRLVGRYLNERGVAVVVPEDQRIKHDILIAPNDTLKAVPGQVVMVEIIEQPSGYTEPIGRIVQVLGEIDDPGMEIEIAVRKFDVPHEFSDAALSLASELPSIVRPSDCAGRIDLRDVPLVTIDGEDARDFDDAVYCEPLDDVGETKKTGAGKTSKSKKTSGWRLLVGIADVSHYVTSGDAIDSDAVERCTSVYFPRRVIPMLPEKLSNGLCSLNPAVDRLVLVCDMVVSADGEVVAYQFFNAVMHSAARFTYDEVWEILSGRNAQAARKREALVPHLQNLYDVFHAFTKARAKRGAIDFDTVETKIVCDQQGRIEQIVARTRNDAHRLIEECMLAANVCSADFLTRQKHEGLYRVHEGPTPEKLALLREFLKSVGLRLNAGGAPTPGDYAALSLAIRGRPDAALLQTMLLRSMQQAIYTPDNNGHFGLAYPAYAHFTSPIRRYPDLLTHRAIKAVLREQRYTPLPLDNRAGQASIALARAQMAKFEAKKNANSKNVSANKSGTPSVSKGQESKDSAHALWQHYGMLCSVNERRADDASRDVEGWLKCQYMRGHIGEEFVGRITGVATFGLFVTLDEMYVEGLVHVSELGSEYFQYNESVHELRGERTGIRYRLTDPLTVQVSRVDLEARRIEFRLLDSFDGKTVGRGSAALPDGKGAKKSKVPRELDSSDVPFDVIPNLAGSKKRGSKSASKTGRAKSMSALPLSTPAKIGEPKSPSKTGRASKPPKRKPRRR
jgi:ribonuclease R